jgi:predicted nucleotidyltransferase/plasmid maintenance system antidote protein VapI
MKSFGELIRELRERQKLPLREVAGFLSIDQAILSKMERGQRRASRDQVLKLAKFFSASEEELLMAWLSDKLVYEVEDEATALKAIELAEARVSYSNKSKINTTDVIQEIKKVIHQDGRISKAWMYGSFARNQQRVDSDIDLIVEFDKSVRVSLFDMAEMAHQMELSVNRKIDLAEKDSLMPFAQATAETDLVKIYG